MSACAVTNLVHTHLEGRSVDERENMIQDINLMFSSHLFFQFEIWCENERIILNSIRKNIRIR